jgi:chromosome segregation ATPase
MNKVSELITLLTEFNPHTSPDTFWQHLLSSEPLLANMTMSEKTQVINGLQKVLHHVKDETKKTQLQHLLSIALKSGLPPALQTDDIDYSEVFTQKNIVDKFAAIKAIQAKTEQEASRLAQAASQEEAKLNQMTKGTDIYTNSLLKQLSLVKQQLLLESKSGTELKAHLQNLEQESQKQNQEFQAFYKRGMKIDEKIRQVEEEYKKNSGNKAYTPHEAQLQRRIIQLEQNLFETTELLKKSNTNAEEVNSILGVEHISASQIKIMIDTLRQELETAQTVTEEFRNKYKEAQKQLERLRLDQLDATQTANKNVQESLRLSKLEAEELRNMYHTRVSAYNQLQEEFTKLQTKLESVNAQQDASLTQLKQQLADAQSESQYYRQRFEQSQVHERQRMNDMQVTLEAEFRIKNEAKQTEYLNKMAQLRSQAQQNAEQLRIRERELAMKDLEIKATKDAMNDQRALDSKNVGKLTERIRVLEKEVVRVTRELQLQADSVAEKNKQLEAVAAQSKYNENIIRSIQQRADDKVALFEKKAEEASAQSTRMMMERDQATHDVIQLKAQLESLRGNLLSSTKNGLTCDQRIAELEKKAASDLQFANEQVTSIKTQYNTLQRKIVESENIHKHADRIRQDLLKEQEQVKKYITEIGTLKQTISQLQVSNRKSLNEKTSLETLLKTCSATQKQAYEVQNSFDQRMQDLTRLHEKEKATLNALVQKQTKTLAQQEASIKELQTKVSELSTKLQESNEARASDQAECRDNLRRAKEARESAVKALIEMQKHAV